MYKRSRLGKAPANQNAILWRYMDVAGFLSLLQREQLFFASLVSLPDPMEGESGSYALIRSWAEDVDRAREERCRQKGVRRDPTEMQTRDELMASLKHLHDAEQDDCASRGVNCWHLNQSESAAMWQLYGEKRGIAVRTTYSRLRRSFAPESRDVLLGQVRYIAAAAFDGRLYERSRRRTRSRTGRSESSADIGAALRTAFKLKLTPFFKRDCFEHEREFRAMVDLYGSEVGQGTHVRVDLPLLLETVLVSPFAPAWIEGVIETELRHYGLDKVPVVRSRLLEPIRAE